MYIAPLIAAKKNYMASFFARLKESRLVKGMVYAVVGAFSYPGLNLVNKLQINGMENLHKLPKQNVLFVSNHQTYFADVITFLHIFCAVSWRKKHALGIPFYLLWPFTRVKYVAAEETMKSNWISKLFSLAGAITVKRTWRAEGQEVRRNLDPSDTRKIERALENNWVITFPQGTTKPFAPGRKGTAFIIKHYRPIVVPVVISGYWRAFNKKGLKFKKTGSSLSVTFKDPLVIDYDDTTENILEKVMDAIEQSKKFMLKSKHHLMTTLDK
ncbi:MAG: 1-acyl-sn-glycerol-3-phosphate acyltransferase [Ferruginibacter sp.]|nr:1-acyl-sn-glycerol-3-phosphate acyltransferase [Ferruginibacter sp.]